MPETLQDVFVSVWRQALIDGLPAVMIGSLRFPVGETSHSKLREVNFQFQGHMYRGLEQNPNTNSRWAQLAREGKKVMQFLNAGRHVANVVDGKLQMYGDQKL